ncbi:hypothetical protein GPALN_004928 [Globodera pallida]|uniref:LITAF domain-containing protein n=1 Tax=Globodera pallida TaxID=36090 RepID=A0A183C659_GLOPA|nr:hypothetical protein GPALN_004928 [Globodera pallida]
MSQPSVPFGKDPQRIDCPHCNQKTTTFVKPVAGILTWLLCIFLCLCCVFCCDSCKDFEHYCSDCKGLVGKCKRI